jgi:hypothetical protein
MSLFNNLSKPVSSTETLERYHTIFGFDTTSKFAAGAIDIIYWFIIFVAYCFAFHALDVILVSWNWLLVGLASLAVVGLPYCVKIILFGRKEFPLKAALLCGFLSILPTIFDFAGFYSETGLQDSLKTSKIEIIDSLSYFEAESKKAAQRDILEITESERSQIALLETQLGETILQKQKDLESARQLIVDEKTGVRTNSTSGKPGEGPRTRELEADVRKLQAQVDLEKANLQDTLARSTADVQKQTKDKIDNINKSTALLDTKIVEAKKSINDAKSFETLEVSVIEANSLISSIASNLAIDYKSVEITGSSNILRLSFEALFALEITAVVCLLLAVLMEIGDIVIVYVIRNEKKKPKSKLITNDVLSKPLIYRKTYEGY